MNDRYYLMGAFAGEDLPADADVWAPLPDTRWFGGWSIEGDLTDPAAVEAAVARAVGTVRAAESAVLAVGAGLPRGNRLLGWTARAVEGKAPRRGRVLVSRRLGGVLLEGGEHPATLELLARARPRDPAALSRWGLHLTRASRSHEAVRVLRRAVRRATDGGLTRRRLADALASAGSAESAWRHARRALAEARADGNATNVVRARYSIANARKGLGDYAKAAAGFARAEAAALGDPSLSLVHVRAARMRMTCLMEIGEYEEVGRIAAGHRLRVVHAETLGADGGEDGAAPAFDQPDEHLCMYAVWAQTALAVRQPEVAEERFRSMYLLADRYQRPVFVERAIFGLTWCALVRGETETAAAYLASRPPRADASNFEVVWQWLTAEVAFVGGDHEAADRELRLVELALEEGRAGNHLEFGTHPHIVWVAADLRARLLAAQDDSLGALAAARRGIQAVEQVRASAVGPWGRPAFLEDKVPLYGLAADCAARLGAWEECLQLIESAGTRAIRERMAASGLLPAPTDAEIAAGHALLEAEGLDGLVVFLGRRDLIAIPLGPRLDPVVVPGAAERVRRLCGQVEHALATGGPVLPLLRTLSGVIAPALALVAGTTRPLVLYPHGPLRTIPWDLALAASGSPGARGVAIGTSVSANQRHPRPPVVGRAVLVAPQVVPVDFVRARLAPDDPPPVQVATRTRTLAVLGRGWTTIVAHGTPTTIELEDGPLRVDDILSTSFQGGVLVLASCSTGAVPGGTHDPLDVVAPAFLAAGVDAVIAPSVPVAASHGISFVLEIVRELDAGSPLIDAWCRARAAMSRQAGGTGSAAPFQLHVRNLAVLNQPVYRRP